MEIEEHRVDVDDVPTRYLSVGSGPALLLLHGIGDSASDWQWVMRKLSRNWSIFAPDMPYATGRDGDRGDFTPERLTRFVLSFLRAVRVARAVVAGHSVGGMIAIRLSLDKPDLVKALVLMDSAGLGQAIHPAMLMEAVPLLGDLAIRLARTPIGSLQRALFRSSLLFSRPGRVPKQWWADQYRLALEPSFLSAELQMLREGTSPLGQRIIFLDRLSELKMPVLVMWGNMDQVVPFFQAQDAMQHLEDGTLCILPGCGHMPHVEEPELCADRISRFAHERARP
jgi:4,5:9,10-diseco-3-hydroxy-5,9,17-trioxoandrosta-1(10),2-diene-4-oate hydrolase